MTILVMIKSTLQIISIYIVKTPLRRTQVERAKGIFMLEFISDSKTEIY